MLSFSGDLLILLATLSLGVVIYFKWSFNFWKRKGLEYVEPVIPFGNIFKLVTLQCNLAEQHADLYRQLKAKGVKHGGVFMFNRPVYVPVNPVMLKTILQKDFSHFVDRGFHVNEEIDPLLGHLFVLGGNRWRNLRTKLSATFTSGKMKMMFDVMAQCASDLEKVVAASVEKPQPPDIKDILTRFTVDVISSCAFGLEASCLKDPNSEMRQLSKRFFTLSPTQTIKNLCRTTLPHKILDYLKLKSVRPDVERSIINLVKDTVRYREENNIIRKDFLHLLIQLKNKGNVDDDQCLFSKDGQTAESGLTILQVAAQVNVFFLAGFETSSSTMNFALYELSKHQDIQDKLRHEIQTVLKKHEKISYEAVMEMHYLDQVISEALRKYPPLAFLNRKCTKAYQIPETDINLEQGTDVVISTLGIHYDPEYYPQPEKFDPERFSEENKHSRPACTYLPFGEGPRICIGMRFGLLQSKLGLITLLKDHKVTLNSKTKEPLVMASGSPLLRVKHGIWLNIVKAK